MDHSKWLTYAAKTGEAFWAGRKAPAPEVTASVDLFNGHHGYRENSQHHGRYSTVYLTELNIGHHPQWPCILDEALRLIAFDALAIFCVRFTQSPFLSVFAFAGYLERRSDFAFDIIDQHVDGNDYIFILSSRRKGQLGSLDSFDFGMISNGSNIPALERFIRSVASVAGIGAINWGIPICGPPDLAGKLDLTFLGSDQERVRFIVEPDKFQRAGWITKKKNLIVAGSAAENIIIAHDRFEIPVEFLDQMRDFGGDYSLVVPRQVDTTGERVGDWVAIESQWGWAPQRLLSYEDFEENIYVNGGIIIAKRAVLIDQGWSNLLFWNQAEDVELSRRLSAHGVTPRMAPGVVVFTRQPRSSYVYNFRRVTSAGNWDSQPYAPLGIDIDLKSGSPRGTFDQGLTVWSTDWFFAPEGLLLNQEHGEITFKYDYSEFATLFITVPVEHDKLLRELRINGNLITNVEWTPRQGALVCEIPLEHVTEPAVPQLVLGINAFPGFCVNAVRLAKAACDFALPVTISASSTPALGLLGKGWSSCEEHHVWSDGPSTTLRLPVAPHDRGKPHRFILKLLGYGKSDQKHQIVTATVDGKTVGGANVQVGGRHEPYSFLIPGDLTETDRVDVRLLISDPISPLELGQSADARRLGVSLSQIDLQIKRASWWAVTK